AALAPVRTSPVASGTPIYRPGHAGQALPPLLRYTRVPSNPQLAAPSQRAWPRVVYPIAPAGGQQRPPMPSARVASQQAPGGYDPASANETGVYPNDAPTISTMRSLVQAAPVAPRQPRKSARKRSA